ncbi:MAG: bifunctional pyr operon transcriptional regulator/uracil phosphoribosyltransferase PyrR [Dehalococcoidia bacterium]|nr:bifunctional pyr operon transcriptional regulator/uracil phosphoribosyltransferase PyrR [Dehalococcoidia bacterium]
MSESIILSEQDIQRTLTRLAHEIIEKDKNQNGLLLIGLRTRGIPLARRISSAIRDINGTEAPVAGLDFTLHRDDLDLRKEDLSIEPSDMPASVTDKRVVLVDDVLFTGRSARAAIDALMEWGRPRIVQLAVLIDRGHREMPIKADFVGKNIPSSLRERVQVRVKEIDGKDEVVLLRDEAAFAAKGDRQ